MHWFSVLSIQCQLLTLELIPDLGHAPVVVGRNSKQLWVEVDAEFVDRQSEDGVRACSRMLRFPLIFSFFSVPIFDHRAPSKPRPHHGRSGFSSERPADTETQY
jgi:hypothetical protein